MREMLQSMNVPEDWDVGIIVLIFMKKENRNTKLLWYHSLVLVVEGIWKNIRKEVQRGNKDQLEINTEIPESRKGRSTHSYIFTMKQLIDKTKHRN